MMQRFGLLYSFAKLILANDENKINKQSNYINIDDIMQNYTRFCESAGIQPRYRVALNRRNYKKLKLYLKRKVILSFEEEMQLFTQTYPIGDIRQFMKMRNDAKTSNNVVGNTFNLKHKPLVIIKESNNLEDESATMQEKRKRLRANGTHRWSEAETASLLEHVMMEVKDAPDMYEKPTSERFYTKFKESSELLRPISWHLLRNKMYNLKRLYVNAANWKQLTGNDWLARGEEESFNAHLQKICPYWNMLDVIFGKSEQIKCEYESFEENSCNTVPECSEESFEIADFQNLRSPQTQLHLCNSPVPISEAVLDCSRLFAKPEPAAVKRKLKELCMENEILKKQKLELEQEKDKVNLEFKKLEFNYNLELRKLELDKETQQVVMIEKMKIESAERIKKYEIELSMRNQLISLYFQEKKPKQ